MKTRCFVALLSFTLCSASPALAETLNWIRQLGTSESDAASGVSADGLGDVYIAGLTEGSLGEPTPAARTRLWPSSRTCCWAT